MASLLGVAENLLRKSRALVGQPKLQVDEAANDSDKSFTVPADTYWEVQSIWVEYISDANAGTRLVAVEYQDSAADVVGKIQVAPATVHDESKTRNYFFCQGVVDLLDFRDTDFIMLQLPKIILPAAFVVRVFDKATIAAATDDMVVQMLVLEYDGAA